MTPAQRKQWAAEWAPAAQAAQKQFGVPASVTLAQAILESSDRYGNCGQSACAKECKNFFGIKAIGSEPYIEFDTREFVGGAPMILHARFEKFASVEDSFARHGELIATEPRYRAAMEVCHDPVAFAAQLEACGYSTRRHPLVPEGEPTYSQILTSLIRSCDLAKYDVPPEPPTSAKGEAA